MKEKYINAIRCTVWYMCPNDIMNRETDRILDELDFVSEFSLCVFFFRALLDWNHLFLARCFFLKSSYKEIQMSDVIRNTSKSKFIRLIYKAGNCKWMSGIQRAEK